MNEYNTSQIGQFRSCNYVSPKWLPLESAYVSSISHHGSRIDSFGGEGREQVWI